jgi:hypothetical protein
MEHRSDGEVRFHDSITPILQHSSSSWYNWQHEMGRMLAVVENGLFGGE